MSFWAPGFGRLEGNGNRVMVLFCNHVYCRRKGVTVCIIPTSKKTNTIKSNKDDDKKIVFEKRLLEHKN